MASLAQSSLLPVIDLSQAGSKLGTASWSVACEQVRSALEEYGCFVAVYDRIAPQLLAEVYRALEDLFDLPVETKAQNVSDLPYHGYLGQKDFIPLHESLGIERSTMAESVRSFTRLMWPDGNDHFRETISSYAREVAELERLVVRMVCEGYGVCGYHESHEARVDYLLRVSRYRGPRENEATTGLRPHTDKSFITVLNQNQVNGLEVKTKGGDWIEFQAFPSSFVVMAGDAALAWSNGRMYSAHHRVTMTRDTPRPRYSVGIFSFHRGVVEVPEEVIDGGHPRRFNSFDHYGLLRFFTTPAGMASPCTVTAYCSAG